MCGISGFIEKLDQDEASDVLVSMASQTVHRGPDNMGFWYDSKSGIGLAHNRLSILDLSSSANQPMVSSSGRYRIVYNGEVYNHLEIRRKLELEGFTDWRGHSDTETILVAVEKWGLKKSVSLFTGMYGFAIWDNKEKKLLLVRDRIGEKPLYYGWKNDIFLFGSELKALRAHKAFTGEIDKKSLGLYLKLISIPAPFTIYQDIFKVEPGKIVTISLDKKIEKFSYWNHPNSNMVSDQNIFRGSYQAAKNKLEDMLITTVSNQMVADVPLGAFLSGGIDSSLVVALMQNISNKKVNTYSISFDDGRYDESEYAQSVAEYLGTNHHCKKVTSNNLLNIVDKIPYIYDEPFADSSQIPSYLVSEYASEEVKVVLTGDGADEVFSGYNRYVETEKYWNEIKYKNSLIKNLLKAGGRIFSETQWDSINALLLRFIPSYQMEMLGNKIYKAQKVIGANDQYELYESIVFIEQDTELILNKPREHPYFESLYKNFSHLESDIDLVITLDQIIGLSSQILTKVDRATMANSLESRLPFLDHKVVEFASSLP